MSAGARKRGREGTHELLVVHVVRGAGDARVVEPALVDELEQVVRAGQDVVHEDDRVKVLVLRVPQLVQRHERGVAHLGEVLDAVVERAARAHRRADCYAQAHRAAERVEDAQERLRLVRRPVLVDRHVHVMVPQDRCDAEERCLDTVVMLRTQVRRCGQY